MIKITELNNTYNILNTTSELKLEGDIYLEEDTLNLLVSIYNQEGNLIANCSYKYRNGGSCSKVLGNTRREYINSILTLLEDTLSFLILRFNFQ